MNIRISVELISIKRRTARASVRESVCLSLALAGGLLLACAAARATVVTNIADGDVAKLKAAITTANSNGDDDVINLARNGTLTHLRSRTTLDMPHGGTNGLPIIVSDSGHSLTINGNGATIQRSNNPKARPSSASLR